MLYRQYLENIRESILNYSLSELKDKDFISILKREKEIEDLSYIDVILKNAGLNISFIGNEDFLKTPVVLKSKLDILYDKNTVKDGMQEGLSDYLSKFV